MTGEELLQVMLQYERLEYVQVAWGYATADYAHDLLGVRDARKLRHVVERLTNAGLIESVAPGYIRPTTRGRMVDAVLQRITAARGGSFQPRLEAGINQSESFALG